MEVNEVKQYIPSTSVIAFEDIVYGRTLGASNHIKMISRMFIDIANKNDEKDAQTKIRIVSEFFKETRGKSSYAIITALNLIEEDIKNSDEKEYKEKVSAGIERYFKDANSDVEKVIEYSKRLLRYTYCVMIFDYSSTVETVIMNAPNKMKVYIPESRSINGGYPFVEKIVQANHEVCFIPDAAMMTVLKEVEMVLIGAETFYADGTAFNTAGSDILAELCFIYHIPYYVITPLLKADIRSVYGQYKEVIAKDLGNVLAKDWSKELIDKVSFYTIELVGIEPRLITGFITEKGILKPSDIFNFVYKEA